MPNTAAERAYAHVKSAILDGSLPGGELLTEGQVAEQIGVSRTPVREAMLRLEAEGMLRLYPKKGAMVVPVTAAEAENVIEARALLENWAARRLFVDAPLQELASQLSQLVEQMRGAQDAGDVGSFSTIDRTFHESIVAAAGNDILTRVYRSLRERQICLSVSVMRVSRERMTVAIAEHTRLVELLCAGDAEGFVGHLDQHMADAAAHLRKAR
uniref:Transcriptional regulator, GntR family n=1 Tax=uncultured Nocardioidaceae bacterium TaxID=253824 RepID=A0A6J4LGR4_9ACTN|nr:MAG: Transcriptional regulator, GntR family [uncultured Nocardioidaceae bacterium]